jgi:hypothetical protein
MGVIAVPREIEAVPTTLARIEGTVNLVAHDLAGLTSRMDRNESDVRGLLVLTQRLDLDAKANERLVTSTALVIKNEKDSAAAALVTEKAKDSAKWSPFAKTIVSMNALVGLAGLVYLFTH